MSNPYQSPSDDLSKFRDSPYVPQVQPGFGWVNQVRIVAVLNCVQGGLEIFMGLFLFVMAAFIPLMLNAQKNAAVQPPEMEWMLPLIYVGLGTPVLLAGILRIYAGVQNFRFRGRILGIVSVAVGCISLFGCYCGPTSIAVGIYTLIVYLNPAVIAAFEMGKQGATGNAILASFATYKPDAPLPPQ